MTGHTPWKDLRRKEFEGNPIGQAKLGLLKRYNRPWWRFIRWWDRKRGRHV